MYYDGDQKAVSTALHDALDYVLARNVADYRDTDHIERRLLQVADYICTVERVALEHVPELGQLIHRFGVGRINQLVSGYSTAMGIDLPDTSGGRGAPG